MAQLIEENRDKNEEYLNLLVDLQIGVPSKYCPLLTKLRDKISYEIIDANFDATLRYDLNAQLDGIPKHKKLCHGDFKPSNIIITEDGTPFILDLAHSTQGNASADAARTYFLLLLNGDIFSVLNPISSCFVIKVIPISSIFINGFLLLPHPNQLWATKGSASFCTAGLKLLIMNKGENKK